jgi:NAD(P)-dependent dehydrogenase (short-subunit alcohol dehydrogenase family)
MHSIRTPTQTLATTPTGMGYAHTFGRPCASTRSWPAPLTPTSASLDGEAFEQRAQGFELERGGLPEEIVGAAFYLASDLSSCTAGPILTVDGGQPKPRSVEPLGW